MHSMTPDEAREFTAKWLPAWTGNNPQAVLSFYTDDVFYLDPTVPEGLRGKQAFGRYLSKLLANNPNWVWTNESAIPLEGGFLNKWRLDAPVGDRTITCRGVCTVQFRAGLIYRNEVYFDTLPLLTALREWIAREERTKPTALVDGLQGLA